MGIPARGIKANIDIFYGILYQIDLLLQQYTVGREIYITPFITEEAER